MKRRSLLGAVLAACAAPAYVRAGILMPVKSIVVPQKDLWAPGDAWPQWFSYDFGAGNENDIVLIEIDHATGMLTLRESWLGITR